MRNLKKVLALALAVVMLVGMMAMGAGAATYKDVDETDNTVAINVVSAIKALEGSNGKFNPDGRLTRGDAAVIAARVALGRETADKLVGATGIYNDVSAKAYYSGAIAWATNEGYLSGDGTGAFRPTGSLYGIHFAKMLLGVLGYDAEIEGFTGKDYVQKILLAGTIAGLFDGLEDVELNGRITRGQAALMAFNALNAREVTYTPGTNITIGNATVTSGGIRGWKYGAEQATLGFMEYGLLHVDAQYLTNQVIGDFWCFVDENGDPVMENGELVYASAPAAVEPTHTIKYFKFADQITEILTNPITKAPYTYNNSLIADADAFSALTGSGVYFDVWVDYETDEIVKVTYTYDSIAHVTFEYDEGTEIYTFHIDENLDEGEDYTITFDDADDADNTLYDILVGMNVDEKEGKMVALTKYVYWNTVADYGIGQKDILVNISETEMVTGVPAQVEANARNFMLNGEKLYVSAKAVAGTDTTLIEADLTEEYNFWLDTTGNVLYAELAGEAAVPSILYVTGVTTAAGPWVGTSYTTVYNVTGYDLTGAVKTFTMGYNPYVKNSTWATGDEYVEGSSKYTVPAYGMLLSYATNDEGTVMTKADEIAETGTVDADVAKTALKFAGKYISDKTVFAYIYQTDVNADSIPENHFDVVTGAHFIEADNVGNYFVIGAPDATDLSLVIMAGAPYAAAQYEEDLLYIAYGDRKFDTYSVSADGKVKLCDYVGYVNGEKITVSVAASWACDAEGVNNDLRGFWTYTVNENGVYTLARPEAPVMFTAGSSNVENYVWTGGGRTYVSVKNNGAGSWLDVDITDAVIYNVSKVSCTTAARLLTIANSAGYDDVYVGVQFMQDIESGNYYATTVYVDNIEVPEA